ncbi:hypothetical protein G4O51_06050 [Candidatus Bathyarchaeota archaeon A05DMB-2]|nr:hypothetical protein [Candidatus Bathyarchaeota archaeon A05DMB-2]
MNPAKRLNDMLGVVSCVPIIGYPTDDCGIPGAQKKRCPLRHRLKAARDCSER